MATLTRTWLPLAVLALAAPIAVGATPTAHRSEVELILEAAREAYGAGLPASAGLVESGRLHSSGMDGSWRRVTDLSTGRMHESVDFGVYRLAETWAGKDHWRQDHSGGVHPLDSDFAVRHGLTEQWLARLGFLEPGDGGTRYEWLGSRRVEHCDCQRLRATPRAGQPVELWFDRRTGLLAGSEWQMPTSTLTVHYDDYRRTSGVLLPRKIQAGDGGSPPDVVTVEHVEVVAKLASSEFDAPAVPRDSEVAGGAATVPISYDGDVVVEAMLNGQGPYAFILDTGGHDILTPEAAKALSLAGVGAGTSGGSGEGTLPEQYTRVREVRIGGVTLRDQSFIVVPLQYDTVERGARPPLAGILGVELFERFAMELDYQGRSLTFRPLEGAPPGHGVPVALRFTDDQPLVSARIEGIEGDNALDTGNSGALVIQGKWAQRHGLASRFRRGLAAAGFGAGGMSRNWISRADLQVAGRRFPQVAASYAEDRKGAFSSNTEAGNIGNAVLEDFVLGFDYGRGLVWFEPTATSRGSATQYSRAGFSAYKEAADAFIVAVVRPGGPAAAAGLSVGDRITAVNGSAAAQLSGWDLRRLVRMPAGTSLSLEVMTGPKPRSVVLALRESLP